MDQKSESPHDVG